MPLPRDWTPVHPAVWRECAPGTTRVINLRHPAYPYTGPNEGALPDDKPETLIDWAATYLRKVSSLLGLGESDIFHPDSSMFLDTVPLAWLPLKGATCAPAPPRSSFWVNRYKSPKHCAGRIERTAVILAVQSAQANDPTRVLGSRLGIRIVAHVSPNTAGPVHVRITGASGSAGLPGALALRVSAAVKFLGAFFGNDAARSTVRAKILEVAGFPDDQPIFYDGLRIIGAAGSRAIVDVYMTALPRPDQRHAPAHAVAAQLLVGDPGVPEPRNVEKWPLVAHAAPVQTRVFTRDPASRAGLGALVDSRPNRSSERLLTYLDTRTLAGVTLGSVLEARLGDDLNQVQVMQSRLVDENADEAAAQVVFPVRVTHPRLDWFAAISGYQHFRGLQPSFGLAPAGLLDRMRAYGLSPEEYFRFASLPIHVRYRAPIDHGGKDGRVVNAQVNFEGVSGDLIATNQTAPPLTLQLKFALADLKRSTSRRQPLGIAADPRWCWHEAGHVLLAASTGALQFRFAHSAGDALAAVLEDPHSALATHPRMRGLTFPWVYLNRRHDRDVFRGWSWSGRYHRPARLTTDVNSYPRKGYQSEQILSTSLFRLYRALGGDTTDAEGAADPAARGRAADYTAYLIMKAIKLMPPAFLAPPETPDQFVSLLIAADEDTSPADSGPLQNRVGGWAHKVVRWAFEAQGLYATTDPLAVVDGPGQPPDPDIFIDDRREASPGGFPRGGYMPASLHWPPAATPSLWLAADDAMQVAGDTVTVAVSARGPSPADPVTVKVWWADWPADQADPPQWNDGTWRSLGTSTLPTVLTWPGRTTFPPFQGSGADALPTAPSGRRLLILATATCAGDPANTEASTGLPCSTVATPIVDLVAGDNNLGLRHHIIL